MANVEAVRNNIDRQIKRTKRKYWAVTGATLAAVPLEGAIAGVAFVDTSPKPLFQILGLVVMAVPTVVGGVKWGNKIERKMRDLHTARFNT